VFTVDSALSRCSAFSLVRRGLELGGPPLLNMPHGEPPSFFTALAAMGLLWLLVHIVLAVVR
jgi:hypothetical protein